MNCRICANMMDELNTCKFCSFELDEDKIFSENHHFDILNMNEDDGWEHHQIMDRLRANGVHCYTADIWSDDVAYIVGCTDQTRVAKLLGMHEEAIYVDWENNWMFLNLFQERYIRGELE